MLCDVAVKISKLWTMELLKMSLQNNLAVLSNLFIINKYYTTNSIKHFFSLLIIKKYYTKNSIKSYVSVQFIRSPYQH